MTIRRRRFRFAIARLAALLAALLLLFLLVGRHGELPGSRRTPASPSAPVGATAPEAAGSVPSPGPSAPVRAPGPANATGEEGAPLVVRGRLLDETGRPLAGRAVCVGGPETLRFLAKEMARGRGVVAPGLRPCRTRDGVFPGAWRLTRTGPDGSFEIRLPRLPGGSYDLEFLGDRGIEARTAGIDLDASAPADLGEVRAAAPGSISGRVVDATGAYVPDAPVQCFPVDDLSTSGFDAATRDLASRLTPYARPREDPRVRLAYADEHGDFAFEGLRPGTYRLYAAKEGTDVGGTLGGVRVETGRLTGPVRVALDTKAGWIAGRVVVRDGGGPPADVVLTAGGTAARADRAGRFRIGPIWPGRIDLVARRPGYRPAFAGPFDVAAGAGVTDVVIELVPAP